MRSSGRKQGLSIGQVQHVCKVVMELVETERHYVRVSGWGVRVGGCG